MHPEIEKLIDLALADGQITEKERNVILKKASELGVDADEVEMVLDGKLHQQEANKPKQKEKVGNIKTCPACGASIKSLDLLCKDCGHEFTNTNANTTIKNLELKIETERAKYIKKNSEAEGGDDWAGEKFNEEELPRILKNYPIPNTKEDLFEVLSFMSSKVISSTNSENEEINAYQAKALEIITKLQFIPNIEPNILERVKEIEEKMKKVKAKNARNLWLTIIFLFGLIYFMYSFFAKLAGYHFWPF
jgi:predicted nucleic acid-binding Zn ribbon protein